MNKIAIFLILILVIAVSPGCMKQKTVPPTITPTKPPVTSSVPPTVKPTQPPVTVPFEYHSWYNEKNKWLEQRLTAWKPTEYRPMKFGGHLVTASEDMIANIETDILLMHLNVLNELNVDYISFYIYPTFWRTQQAKYDAIVSTVRQDGKELFIGHASGGEYKSIQDYKADAINTIKEITKKYKPEYYSVVVETHSMNKRLKGISLSDDEWYDFVVEASKAVKEVNPSTKVLATVNNEDTPMVRRFAGIATIDGIGFNIYNRDWIPLMEPEIDYVEGLGKETYVVETWYGGADVAPYLWRAPLDGNWIKVITYFAQNHKMEGVNPFFTLKYVDYFQKDATLGEVKRAFEENKRTPVYDIYKETINEIRHTPP